MTDEHAGDSTRQRASGGHEAVPLDPEVYRALGLTDDEAARIVEMLGRVPNDLELAQYSVMWSEHCSYKSSRIHLGRLPSEGDHVLVGPGEGAGVVDVGDGIALALRIESHNHPSFVEPYEGAATGMGGILRDIYSMGARPLAVCDPVRFGPLDDDHSRWVAEQAAEGVANYSRIVGVPVVGGETVFDRTYVGNPLINVLALGILRTDDLMLGRATGVGNDVVLLGAATGRDGIGGVSVLASASFDDVEPDDDTGRVTPAGDPELARRVIEACLELYRRDLAVGVQDLGGAGLTCATAETAAKGDSGMDVFVDRVRPREDAMTPVELLISESQERMLVIVEPARLDAVLEVAARWEVPATVVGRVTDSGNLRVIATDAQHAAVFSDVPAKSLEEGAPKYDRPRAEPADLATRRADDPVGHLDDLPVPLGADLLAMLCDSSRVWSSFDHEMTSDLVSGPGADAAVLRLVDPESGTDTGRGVALTSDGNHRWCAVDPRVGTAAVVAESILNLACVGARPLALVNNLNFGNPENPEVMWQLSETVDGMAEACRQFDVPVIGGNVSLYNASGDADIDPSPVVGTLGIIDTLSKDVPGPRLADGTHLVLLGNDPAASPVDATMPSGLAGSRWAFDHDLRGGSLVPVDFDAHERICGIVRKLVVDDAVAGITDVSEGGLIGVLAEMVARDELGARIDVPDGAAVVPWLFGEAPSRALACVDRGQLDELRRRCADAGVPYTEIGSVGGGRLVATAGADPVIDLGVAEVTASWRDRLPDAFAAGSSTK